MIGMQMSKKNFVEELVRNHVGRNIVHGAATDIEQEFFAVAKLDEKAGRCLVVPRCGHAGAACGYTNLFPGKLLSARVVNIAVRGCFCAAVLLPPCRVTARGKCAQQNGGQQTHRYRAQFCRHYLLPFEWSVGLNSSWCKRAGNSARIHIPVDVVVLVFSFSAGVLISLLGHSAPAICAIA